MTFLCHWGYDCLCRFQEPTPQRTDSPVVRVRLVGGGVASRQGLGQSVSILWETRDVCANVNTVSMQSRSSGVDFVGEQPDIESRQWKEPRAVFCARASSH